MTMLLTRGACRRQHARAAGHWRHYTSGFADIEPVVVSVVRALSLHKGDYLTAADGPMTLVPAAADPSLVSSTRQSDRTRTRYLGAASPNSAIASSPGQCYSAPVAAGGHDSSAGRCRLGPTIVQG